MMEAAFDVRRGKRDVDGADAFRFSSYCWDLGLWKEAEFWARHALPGITDADTSVRAYTLLTVSLAEQHRWGAALAEVDRYRELPDGASADAVFQWHVNAGRILLYGQRYQEALDRFDHGDQHGAEADAEQRTALELNRGAALHGLGRGTDAVAAYRRALGSASERMKSHVLTNLGNAHRTLGDLEEAARWYAQAIEAAGDDLRARGAALSNFGELRMRQGRAAEARALLEASVEVRARAGDDVGRAISLGRLGRLAASRIDVRQALALTEEARRLFRDAGVSDDPSLTDLAEELTRIIKAQENDPEFAAHFLVEQLRQATRLDDWASAIDAVPPQVVELAHRQLSGELPSKNDIGPILRRTLTRYLSQVLEMGTDFAIAREHERQAELEGLTEAILTLSRTTVWLERKRYYESKRTQFDSEEVDGALGWIEHHTEELGTELTTVAKTRALIEACHTKGIDRAFAELPEEHPGDLISRLVMVGTWRETRCLVEAHTSWYLSDEAMAELDQLLPVSAPLQRNRVEAHQDLLRRCRTDGVERAFANIPAADADPSGQKLFVVTIPLGKKDDREPLTIAKESGDPMFLAAANHDLARRQLERTDGDRVDNLRSALRLLVEARSQALPQTMPQLHASIGMHLGHVLLELAGLEPEETKHLTNAVGLFANLADESQAPINPQRIREAANGLHDSIEALRQRGVTGDELRKLDGLHARACRAAVAATDALARSGELSERQSEFAASLWAYLGAVEAAFDLPAPAAALVAAEQGRGRGFLTEVGHLDELPAFVPRSVAVREAAARERLRVLRAQAAAGKTDEADEAAFVEAERELRAVHDQLAMISPELAYIREGNRPTVEELTAFARSLSPQTLVLAWYSTPSRCLAFALAGGTGDVLAGQAQLSWGDLESYVHLAATDIWRQPSRPDQGISPAWRELTDALIPQAWHDLVARAREVLLVPHGLLHELPLHALPLSCLGGRSLVETAPVRHLPSITLAQRLRERRRGGDTAVVLANPDDDAGRTTEFGEEARAVAATLRSGSLFLGPDANRNRIAELGARASILHVAAHGFFDPDDPLGSGLILSDGVLAARDVIGSTRLPGTIVVLSGCESNRRTVRATDESEGLVRAFLVAGASAIVASQWRVDSRSTRQLMDTFHQNLARSGDTASALRLATLALRGVPATAHPYYWAPFVAVGV
jgi:tetratricopeptide (TPR) repeat protein